MHAFCRRNKLQRTAPAGNLACNNAFFAEFVKALTLGTAAVSILSTAQLAYTAEFMYMPESDIIHSAAFNKLTRHRIVI